MRVKVLTKDHGEFMSDELTVEYTDLLELIAKAAQGTLNRLTLNYNEDKIFFTEEVLKSSVFIVTKD